MSIVKMFNLLYNNQLDRSEIHFNLSYAPCNSTQIKKTSTKLCEEIYLLSQNDFFVS